MTPETKAKRDELAAEHAISVYGEKTITSFLRNAECDFKAGFDAAWAMQQERIDKLRKAHEFNDAHIYQLTGFAVNVASEALALDDKLARGEK